MDIAHPPARSHPAPDQAVPPRDGPLALLDHLARSAGPALEWVVGGDQPALLPALAPSSAVIVGGPEAVAVARRFDLVLLRGRPGPSEFRRACELLGPEGVLALLASPDPALDVPKAALFQHAHATGGPGFPGGLGREHLWIGGRTPPGARWVGGGQEAASAGRAPLLVNFYTRNTPYEHEARKLADSCKALGVDLLSEAVEPRGSWEFNCAYKASFLKRVHGSLNAGGGGGAQRGGGGRAIVWVDADAIVRRAPVLLHGDLWDFAIHKHYGWMFASGTVYFGPTDAAAELLDRWTRLCEIDPAQWDQVHLGTAWEDVAGARPLRTLWLPEAYTRVFDFPAGDPTAHEPVIEHFQASARFKSAVSGGAAPQARGIYPIVQASRAASRPPTESEARAGGQVYEHLTEVLSVLMECRPASVLLGGTGVEAGPAVELAARLLASAGRPPEMRLMVPGLAELARNPSGAESDVVVVLDPDLAGLADPASALHSLQEAARLAVVLGVPLSVTADTPPKADRRRTLLDAIAAARPAHQKIYPTLAGRPYGLFVWARRPLVRLEAVCKPPARVPPPAPAGQVAPGADAALLERLEDLNYLLGARIAHGEHLERAVLRSFAAACAARGQRRIALYGAGRHTQRHLEEPWRSAGIQVVAVLDDAPAAPALGAIPVMRPDELREPVDAVVVSSDAHEEALARAAERLFGPRGTPVLRIYHAPFDFSTLASDARRRRS